MKHFEYPAPHDEQQFQRFMEALDRHFAEMRMPIPGRALAAAAEIGQVLGKRAMRIPPLGQQPHPGCYADEDLVLRAVDWFEQRYGSAQEVYMGAGRGFMHLRGDRWLIEYPTIIGRAGLFAGEPGISTCVIFQQRDGSCSLVARDAWTWLDPALQKLDVLDFVKDLPPGLRASLNSGELAGLLYVFCRNLPNLNALKIASQYRFIKEARADLDAAATHLVARPAAGGPAQWACLQAVEKTFKSFLHYSGRPFPTSGGGGHDLRELARLVAEAGGPVSEEGLIAAVQCGASERDEADLVSVDKAHGAHRAAIELCGPVALVLRHLFPSP